MNKYASQENKHDHIAKSTKQERQNAIDCPKRGKAGGTEGMKAEDLKDCDDETSGSPNKHDPKVLENIVIKVIYKKVMRQEMTRDSPICTLSTFYNEFSTLLETKMLHRFQSSDQGGSDEVARLQTTPHTHCLNKKAGSGRSTCGSPRPTSQRPLTRYSMMRHGELSKHCFRKSQTSVSPS